MPYYLTWLSRCSLASYQESVRFDRSVQRGGGVTLFVGSSFPCSPLPVVTPLEAVAAQIYLPQCHLTVCSLYLPLQLPNDSLSEHLTSLTRSLPSPYLLAMDANAHHPHWGSPAVDARGAILFDFLDTANLVCLNLGEPTFCSSSGLFSHIDQFDLTFCSPTLAPLFSWHPHFDSFNSDHFPILLDSSFSYPCTSSIPKWNLSVADWDRFRSDLHLPTQFESPDESCQSTSDALLSAATHSVPLSTPRPRRRVAFWWTRACTEARRKKNVALTRYRHHRGDVSAWIKFKKAQASFRLTIRQAKQSSWSQFVSGLSSSCTSSQVWKRVCLLRASVKRRPHVLLENGTHLSAPPAVAELLAETFATKSDGTSGDQQFMAHKVQSETVPVVFSTDNSLTYNRPFSISELSLALSSSSSRALGIDRIPYSFLRQLSHPQRLTLLRFFNYIFQNGYPSQWHFGVIPQSLNPLLPLLTNTPTAQLLSLTVLARFLARW